MERCIKTLGEIKRRISQEIYKAISAVSPYLNTQIRFWRTTGQFINLKTPRTFSEKISWLKLYRYANDPLVKQCADKLRVRDYVTKKGLKELLIPLIASFERTEDIIWEELPEKFALKWNYGCGFNILCRDKKSLDIPAAVHQLKKWGRNRYWLEYSEMQYRIEEHRILCEHFLETPPGEGLLDYKFYCFHGKVLAVLVIARTQDEEKAAVLMSPEWNLISDIPSRYQKTFLPEKPGCLEKMRRSAEILSEPFPFVRVDLYDYKGQPLFGEMTFTPAAGIFPSEALIDGKCMGDYIDLGFED